MRQLLQYDIENSYWKFIIRCDRGLLHSASGIKKCDRVFLQSASVLQSLTVITKWHVTEALQKYFCSILMAGYRTSVLPHFIETPQVFHYSTLLTIYTNETNLGFNKNAHDAIHETQEQEGK